MTGAEVSGFDGGAADGAGGIAVEFTFWCESAVAVELVVVFLAVAFAVGVEVALRGEADRADSRGFCFWGESAMLDDLVVVSAAVAGVLDLAAASWGLAGMDGASFEFWGESTVVEPLAVVLLAEAFAVVGFGAGGAGFH